MPKTCEKPFYKNITAVLCKKPLEKTNSKYSRNETILKIGHLGKATAHAKASVCKMATLCQKLKMPKTWEKNHSTRTMELFCAKTPKKNYSRNKTISKNRICCKGYSQWKGCLCEKPLEKKR